MTNDTKLKMWGNRVAVRVALACVWFVAKGDHTDCFRFDVTGAKACLRALMIK